MQNWQNKLKDILLLSDDDADLVLKADFKTLMKENKDGAIRVLSLYGAFLVALLIFIALFSFFGGLCKIILILIAAAVIGGLGFFIGKDNLIKASKIPAISYFVIFLLSATTLSMFSDVSRMGSGGSKFLLLLIVGGLGAGVYFIRPKVEEKGWSSVQLAIAALLLSSFILSFQVALIQVSIDNDINRVRVVSELRRQKQAEQIRRDSMASPQKACTTDEECRKMNTKKNEYYAKFEEIAMETCEKAVSKEIPSRFEWTVSPKEYKFSSYQVDVLQDQILLAGDKAQLIDGSGNKKPFGYVCRYNTKTKTTEVMLNK